MLFMRTYILVLLQCFWCYQNGKASSKSLSVVLVSGTHILTTALIPVLSKYEDPRVVSPPCLSAVRSEPSMGFNEGLIYDLHWNIIIIKRISGWVSTAQGGSTGCFIVTRTTHSHAGTHACMHARTHACTHAHTHTHARTHAHAHMHAHARARTHARTHTHTRTHPHLPGISTLPTVVSWEPKQLH